MPEEQMGQIFSYQEIPREEFILTGTKACPGCGPLLGLRLTLKMIASSVKTIVIANGPCASIIGSTTQVPYAVVERLEKVPVTDEKIVAFDQLGNLDELENFVKNNDNFLIVTYNNEEKPLVKIMNALGVTYVATANISHPLDLVNKVRKAMKHKKAFIHMFAPCPTKWGFDYSNTIEVGKSATSSGFWPLYEINNKEFVLTFKPRALDSVKNYLETQKRFKNLTNEEKEKIEQKSNKNWKFLQNEKFWLTE